MKSVQINTAIPGPKSLEILKRRLENTPIGLGKATEISVHKASGALLEDVDGNIFIDFAGGIGMANVGHSPTAITKAIHEQIDKYLHTSMLVTTIVPYVELAELLNKITPGDFKKKTLLSNSGAEAVETAIAVSKYFTKRSAIICFEGGYHGRTLLTLSLTSKYSLFKKGYAPFASDIYRLPVPNFYRKPSYMSDEQYLQYSIDQFENAFIAQVDPSDVAAIIIEPVQGEAGFISIHPTFLQKIREVCSKHGMVMIADEIQAGFGRTGKLFSIEHSGITPDIVVMAKSLGAGLPIAAITGRAEILDAPHLGGVGGTYGGSPVACVAAIEAVKEISKPAFLQRAISVGNVISERLGKMKEKYSIIGDARGIGAMQILEFVKNRETKQPDMEVNLEIMKSSIQQGLILIRAGLYSNCIRLLPPLVITDSQLNEGLDILENAISLAQEKRK